MVREHLKVLIVDDDPFIAEMYRLRLEAEGYEVITARDGEEGLATAGSEAPSSSAWTTACLASMVSTLVRRSAAPRSGIPVIVEQQRSPAVRIGGPWRSCSASGDRLPAR